MVKRKITLQGGPYSGRWIRDRETSVIRMSIAKRWEGVPSRPAIGAETGVAVYEPDAERRNAHWLENRWEGICEGNIEL